MAQFTPTSTLEKPLIYFGNGVQGRTIIVRREVFTRQRNRKYIVNLALTGETGSTVMESQVDNSLKAGGRRRFNQPVRSVIVTGYDVFTRLEIKALYEMIHQRISNVIFHIIIWHRGDMKISENASPDKASLVEAFYLQRFERSSKKKAESESKLPFALLDEVDWDDAEGSCLLRNKGVYYLCGKQKEPVLIPRLISEENASGESVLLFSLKRQPLADMNERLVAG